MDVGRDVADHQNQDAESGAARESTAHRTPFVIRLGYWTESETRYGTLTDEARPIAIEGAPLWNMT